MIVIDCIRSTEMWLTAERSIPIEDFTLVRYLIPIWMQETCILSSYARRISRHFCES